MDRKLLLQPQHISGFAPGGGGEFGVHLICDRRRPPGTSYMGRSGMGMKFWRGQEEGSVVDGSVGVKDFRNFTGHTLLESRSWLVARILA